MAQLQSTSITGSLIVTGGITGSFSGSIVSPGSTTQVLFNNSGVISANSGFVYSGGNVGIGTSSPGRKLTVYDTVDVTNGQLRLGYNDDYYWDLGRDATLNGRFMFVNKQGGSASELVSILPSGNVGIGTSSPSTKLTVSDTNTITNQIDFIGFASSAKGHIGEFANNLYISTNYFYNGSQNADDSSLGQAAIVLSAGTTTTSFIDLNLSDAGANNPTVKVRILSNGNVGIGTTSPSQKLHVVGSRILVEDTNAGIMFRTGGTNRYSVASTGGEFLIYDEVNSTSRLYITSSGNVGIGTTSPISILNTSGTSQGITHDDSQTGRGYIRFRNGGNQLAFFGVAGSWEGSSLQDTMIAAETGLNIRFYTNGSATPKMFISDSGNVGIGTTSPYNGSRLEVRGSGVWDGGTITLTNSGTGGGSWSLFSTNNSFGQGAGKFLIYNSTAGTNALIIDSSNNIGIGTSSPGGKLHVEQDSNSGLLQILRNSNTGTSQYVEFKLGQSDSSELRIGSSYNFGSTEWNQSWLYAVGRNLALKTSSGYAIRFYTGGTDDSYERMRITTDGNVGIGTTNPSTKLQVAGNIYVSNNGGNVSFNRPGGQNVGAIGWYSDDKFYVAGHPDYGPGAGNDVRVYGFGSNLYLGSSSGGDVVTITPSARMGINITNPSYRLEVNGGSDTFVASFINSSASQSFIRVGDSSDLNYSGLALYSDSGSGQMFKNGTGSNSWGGNASLNIYNSNGSIAFHPNNTANAMFIATSGNVGIGTTSPGYKLDVNGAGRFIFRNNSNEITDLLLSTESANSKSKLSFLWYGNETAAVKFLRGGNSTGSSMEFWTQQEFGSTTQRMTITSAGNVGIGTTSPSDKLQVIGNGRFGVTSGEDWGIGIDHGIGSNDYGRIRFYQNGSNYSTIHSFSQAWQSGTVFNSSSGALNFDAVNGATFGLWYDPDVVFVKGGVSYFKNNVGIGTTSPSQKLHVVGNILSSNVIYWNNGVGALSWDTGLVTMETNSATAIAFNTNGSEKMRITSGGNVGIGTTNPGATLAVGTQSSGSAGSGVAANNSIIGRFGAANTASRVVGLTIANTATATIGNDSTLSFIVAGNYSATGLISTILQDTGTAASDMAFSLFANSLQERMRIQGSTGNVGIGTTNPGYKLDVSGEIRMNGTTSSGAVLGGIAASWNGNANYPTLYGTSADRYVMHINPHISYVQNGTNGYAGTTTGAVIRFASNPSAANYWDLGVGVNSVGEDKYSLGRGGSSFLAINSTGNVGIGTTNPGSPLTVVGDISGTTKITIGTSHTNSGTLSSIAGGTGNTVSGACSFVGGGCGNTANNTGATIAGGRGSTASGIYSTVGGGGGNPIVGFNVASGCYSTVSGGYFNRACNSFDTVSGGKSNRACGFGYSTVGGGQNNTAGPYHGVIGGGLSNTASAYYTTIGGGKNNTASGTISTIGGGQNNTASSQYSVVGGGYGNTASGASSTVSGGYSNTASGKCSSILGGQSNLVTGCFSGILGGTTNRTDCTCSFIVGSNIIADRNCATFVNNLSIMNIPTSSAGLPSGAVYKDALSGQLFIV